MILSMWGQASLFVLTVGVGFFIGFVYDVFRIIRKTFKHGNWLTQLEDIIYWLLVSFVMFYFMLNKNYGEIRLFSILGAMIGMLLYFLTISAWIIKISVAVISFIKRVLTTTLKLILFPFKIILRLLTVPMGLLNKTVIHVSAPAKNLLRKSSKYAKMKKDSVLREFRIILKKI